MNYKHMIRSGCVFVITALLVGLLVTPVSAFHGRMTPHLAGTSANAIIYLPTATLALAFQRQMDQAVPRAFNDAITGVVERLPVADRGLVRTMAATLFQPKATLTHLAPQQDGLAASLLLSLYPGDPQPIAISMLIKFSVQGPTTIAISAQPLAGSPALGNGRVTTFQIPFGQLNSITTTPNCGDSAVSVNLQMPTSLSQGETTPQVQQGAIASTTNLSSMRQPLTSQKLQTTPDSVTSYGEIPASSLAAMGRSIGSLPISNNLTAENFQISVQGSDIVITSDIVLNSSFRIGVVTSTLQPMASNGHLAVHVLSTQLTVFDIFTFPYDTYNQQIEQTINQKLATAMTGQFRVTDAAIGPNSHIPCAASDSLVLTGAASLV